MIDVLFTAISTVVFVTHNSKLDLNLDVLA